MSTPPGRRRPLGRLLRATSAVGLFGLLLGAGAVWLHEAAGGPSRTTVHEDPAIATWHRVREATKGCRDLREAVAKRDCLAAAALLLRGEDVDARDEINQTPLHLAAVRGHDDVAKLLIGAGADVNAQGNGGQTPLHNTLLDLGCWGDPPFVDYAGRLRVADLLLDAGADVDARTRQGQTSLHLAAAGWYRDLLLLLLRRGADIEAKDKWGQTPLHVAARCKSGQAVKLLLAQGADPRATDNDGLTPFQPAKHEIATRPVTTMSLRSVLCPSFRRR